MRLLKSKRQSTDQNQRTTTFRISQFGDVTHYRSPSSTRTPFQQKRNHLNQVSSKSILKLSTKRTINASTRNLRHGSVAMQALTKLVKLNSSEFAQLITREIQASKRRNQIPKGPLPGEILTQLFKIAEHMFEEVYSYKQVQTSLSTLHGLVKKLGSSCFVYRAYAFSGFVCFQYGSYSLALYYFDRTLKSFYDRKFPLNLQFQKKLQMQIYKCVCRIFLIKSKYIQAKNFAYKLLRKAWIMNNIDEQMCAYDLLGKVYMQLQAMTMCQYFHWRMSSGEKQQPQILAMSNQQMLKQARQKLDYVCYQTINIFVDKDAKINDILQNHYRVRSLQHAQISNFKDDLDSKTIYVYTHHSPNRLLANYHLLERKMIEAKQSKELHFIRPKDSHRLKKIFSDFSALIHQIIQKYNGSQFGTEYTINNDDHDEESLIQ